MSDHRLKDFAGTRNPKLGHFIVEFATPGIGHILKSAGGSLTEMARSGRDTFCCGAGGGRILAEETPGSRINELRARMARETGTPLLVSSCPFCLTMFEDGIKTGGHEGNIVVRDLAEIVAERLTA